MTSSFEFTPATRRTTKARIALAGPSGSGKTYTALITAGALGDRIAVIDTERGSAAKYAGNGGFTFDHLDLVTYEPQTLIAALASAGAEQYDVVIVDSLSHFWMGQGGMLEQADNAGKRSGGNSFAGWREMRPIERKMLGALLAYPGHVIVTMRTKTEWVVEPNDRGKSAPRKVGTKPEQRDGIEYEFDVVGEMDQENTLVVSKSRIQPLAGQVIRRPDESFGVTIRDWLADGDDAGEDVPEYVDRALELDDLDALRNLLAEVRRRRLDSAAVLAPDGTPTTLGELIVSRGHAVRAATDA